MNINIDAKVKAVLATALVYIAVTAVALYADRSTSTPAVVTAMVRFKVELGDRLTSEGQFGAARLAYDVAAKLVRAERYLPVEEVRRIANSYYFEGKYEDAAATLDRLAEEAEAFGDRGAQARAVADAAWVADLGGDESEAARHLERLEPLLGSPALPDDVREEIQTKLMADLEVFAPHLVS